MQFLLDQLAGTADARQIVCWPPESAGDFLEDANGQWTVVPQSGTDLGSRMTRWFESALEGGGKAAIAIGADCPFVQPKHVQQTRELLNAGNDLVLGPAADGGYWLVGMNRHPGTIFDNTEWGAASVLETTLQNAKATGWKTALLESLRDVDDLEDLSAAVSHLLQSTDSAFLDLAQQLSSFVQVDMR